MDNIIIKHCIVHILDSTLNIPVLSDKVLDLSSHIKEYLAAHLEKFYDHSGLSDCYFDEDNQIHSLLLGINDTETFIDCTKTISSKLFSIMRDNIDIPSCDVIFISYEFDHESYFAMLKMNYRTAYIHLTENDDNNNFNKIIEQKTVLPNITQKADELFTYNFTSGQLQLLEKQYEINGIKEFYLSGLLLNCSTEKSPKEKFNIINKTVNSMQKKHFTDDIEQNLNVKKAIYESIEDSGEIAVEEISKIAFENNFDLRQEFKEKVKDKGIVEDKIEFKQEHTPNRFKKQKLQTETGIEINIPIEQYGNNENLEFINNPDGTISILIKNIKLKS